MNIRKLEHLLAVIDNRNMRAAAEAIHLSQPALSRSVKSLEDELGLILLDRSYGKVQAATYSAQVVQHIRRLTSEARALNELVRRIRGLDEGEIRVGFGPFVASTVLGRVTTQLIQRHPRLSFHVEVNNPSLLVEFLSQGRLDLIVCDSRYAEDMEKVSMLPLPRLSLAFVASTDHPLRGRKPLRLIDLKEFPLAGPMLPPAWLNALASKGLNYSPSVKCDDTHLLLELAASTAAVALLPEPTLRSTAARASDIAPLPLRLPIDPASVPCIMYAEGKTLGPAAKVLIELIQASFTGQVAAPAKRQDTKQRAPRRK